jgi:hypothetical protein
MIVVWGVHRFSRKVAGYRNDFCLNCHQNQVAEWWRSFNVGHLYWIPLIPMGTRYEWRCSVCGIDPHARVESSKGFKVFVAGFFVLLALFVLAGAVVSTLNIAPDFGNSSQAPVLWTVFLGAGAIAAGAVFWATRPGGPTNLSEQLQRVPRLSSEQCHYCKGKLDAEGHCVGCDVTHFPLEFV